MADCSSDGTYDPLRNQLTRVIENVLTFQAHGAFPERVFFTLLTPRLFKDNPGARLYAYKMREYKDRDRLLHDLRLCRIPPRNGKGYVCPDLAERVEAL